MDLEDATVMVDLISYLMKQHADGELPQNIDVHIAVGAISGLLKDYLSEE